MIQRPVAGSDWRTTCAAGSMAVVSQPSPLAAAVHRAQALQTAGDLAGARATLEHALAGGRVSLGEDDPAVLAGALQLADVHRQADDPSAARRVLEEAFAAGQRRLSDAEPLMLAISFDLGLVAEELGNRHEARRAFGRLAAHGPQALGEDHWAVRQARKYLGEDPATARMSLDQPIAEWDRVTDSAARTETGAPLPQPQPLQTVQIPNLAPPDRPAPRPAPAASFEVPLTTAHPGVHVVPQPAPIPAPVPERTAVPWPQEPPVPVQRFGPGTERPAEGGALDGGRAAYPGIGRGGGRGRGWAIFAAFVAGLAVVIAVVALVVVLAARKGGDGDVTDVPTLGGRPPTDVRLRDVGSVVELSWRDPTDGTVSFVVMGGHPDEQLRAMGRLGPSQTRLRLQGLNAKLDYCFTVVAVYATDRVSPSPQACTSRTSPRPAPSTSG